MVKTLSLESKVKMSYVIKYNDGSYNRGMGHPVTLLEADVYVSKEEADSVAEDLTFDAQAVPCPEKVDLISQRNAAASLYFNAKQVEIPELLRKINELRHALNELLVPYNESVERYKGIPSGVYVQRFRFEQAIAALDKTK